LSEGLEIRVPDIGDFDEVEVVEVLVAKGDRIELDAPLVSIESDKATMEIPATAAGVIAEVRVAEGDRVSEGSVLVVLKEVEEGTGDASEPEPEPETDSERESADATPADEKSADAKSADAKPADTEAADKADAESVETERAASSEDEDAPSQTAGRVEEHVDESEREERPISPAAAHPIPDRAEPPHASPLVRRFARELGVPIEIARGSGPKGRILVDDLKQTVRERFAADSQAKGAEGGGASPGLGIPAIAQRDHAAFGPVREQALGRIQRVSGPALHRSWLNVPHVTQHDDADVTALERFRRDRQPAAAERGLKLSPLLFVMKAVVVALHAHPVFRASLAAEGDRLIIKEYFHLGIAVDTEEGLIVPVIRDVDRKGVFELAEELAATAERARSRKLSPDELRGASFTISSLGGIGGTAFSPIVNAPEVAILGLSKMRVQPVWQGAPPLDPAADPASEAPRSVAIEGEGVAGRFLPRMILPLSLSYDHRVIDGAEAARFTSRLARLLSDPMQLLL